MDLQIAVNAAGGLALFLLAMLMMTEGLKVFAGRGLKQLLARWTYTPLRGVLAGVLVTGVVQSSSAVTVATIGFVNAGVLTLRQALGVIFGTNVGTTMTGWLVSLVGFGFQIESFALPTLAIGVALRLVARDRRHQGLGEALAGFGLFFLGLGILRDAVGGLAGVYGVGIVGTDTGSLAALVGAGFVITVLTQSSSAAIAIILTAAAGGVVNLGPAAAAVIGANLGTTSTAAIAALRATPAAKRLALGHIAFNAITGIVALAVLPVMLWAVGRMAGWLDVEGSPAAVLALFHTLFNVLGVVIMLPLAGRLAALLERLFRSAADDISRPQHLDSTLATTPELAVAALRQELFRLRATVAGIVRAALGETAPEVEHQSAAARALGEAIGGFIGSVQTATMSRDAAGELAQALNAARYLQEAARLAPQARLLAQQAARQPDAGLHQCLRQFLADAAACAALAAAPREQSGGDVLRGTTLEQLVDAYHQAKEAVLHAAAGGRLAVEAADALLDVMSSTRRMVEQLVKGDRMLRNPGHAAGIKVEKDA